MPRCKKCSEKWVERNGRYGPFFACPNSRPADKHGSCRAPFDLYRDPEAEEPAQLQRSYA